MGYVADDRSDFTVRWRRPRRGTISNTTDKVIVYTAPHRISHAIASDLFWVTIRSSRVGYSVRFSLPVTVLIVRRNWRIETEVVVDQPCAFFYTLGYFWKEQGTFSIGDNRKITKNSAAIAQTSDPSTIWGLCSQIPHGYTAITPTGDFEVDVQFEFLNGGPLSFIDVSAHTLVIYGHSAWKGGSATLTGPGASPFLVSVGANSLGFDLNVSYFEEGVWFDGSRAPSVTTHRHRIFSVDTP